MIGDKTIIFKVKGTKKTFKTPKWREVDVENAECPSCHGVNMTVVVSVNGIYAHCSRCGKYFVGE